jgi:hypothetical protein
MKGKKKKEVIKSANSNLFILISIEFKESAPIIEFLRSEVKKEIHNTAYKVL